MKRIILLVLAMLISLSLISCTANKDDEKNKVIGIDEFKESILKKYDLEKIEIVENEENKEMIIDYYFNLGPVETDMTALKYQSLLYYKPREDKYDTLTVNIYNKDDEKIKVYTYKNQNWTESE